MIRSAPRLTGTLLAMLAASCRAGEDQIAAPVAVPVGAVEVQPVEATLVVGDSIVLDAVVRDSRTASYALDGRIVTWRSSRPEVATVSASGVVTANQAGMATMTVTSEGVSASAMIWVAADALPAIGSVRIVPAVDTLAVGASLQLMVVVRDLSGNLLTRRAVRWSSDAPNIARVSPHGIVIGVEARPQTTTTRRATTTVHAIAEGHGADSRITVTPFPHDTTTLRRP